MSANASLQKFSPEGNKLWHFKVGLSPSGFAVGSDGTVYTFEATKGLLAISADGMLLWRDEQFRNSSYSSISVANNGLLYLFQDNRILALKLPGN